MNVTAIETDKHDDDINVDAGIIFILAERVCYPQTDSMH